jgi:hypothetical protein
MKTLIVTRITTGWMTIITILMTIISIKSTNNTSFYRFGPQPDLIILGFTIDTPGKYALVVLYALINTAIRSMNHNIVTPWITLNVQNTNQSGTRNSNSNSNSNSNHREQYEICIFNTMYTWFDWLIYIHMLLAQADMVLIEMTTDVIATCIVTRWYIKSKQVNNIYSSGYSYEESLV